MYIWDLPNNNSKSKSKSKKMAMKQTTQKLRIINPDEDKDEISCGFCGETLTEDLNMGSCMCGAHTIICQDCGKWSETEQEWLCGKEKCVSNEDEALPKCDECDCGLTEDDEKYWCNSRGEYICEECHSGAKKCDDEGCDCCGCLTDAEDEPEPEPVKPHEYNCLIAQYEPRFQYFKIPDEWDKKDITVIWGKLFYKGEPQDVPVEIMEGDEKRPVEISIEAAEDMPFWKDE